MPIVHQNIISLVEYLQVDRFYVTCHFKCKVTNKTVISSVPFEPYDGKIELSWSDMLFHPFKSYNRYYHTPITIYGSDTHETIVLKAFKKVAKSFTWSYKDEKYIYFK